MVEGNGLPKGREKPPWFSSAGQRLPQELYAGSPPFYLHDFLNASHVRSRLASRALQNVLFLRHAYMMH
jgi:hypothetical protein